MARLLTYAERPGRGPRHPDGLNLTGSISSLAINDPLELKAPFRGRSGNDLQVYATASLQEARDRLGRVFSTEKQPDGSVIVRRIA